MVIKNKRGWLKILEAFVAVLLISGVLLLIINQGDFTQNRSSRIYDIQISILREIQLNQSLRQEILDTSPPKESGDSGFPSTVEDKIGEKIPVYLECRAKVCGTDSSCKLELTSERNEIYAQDTLITSTLSQGYNPRRLKLFCWLR